jgi:Heterokaryon incompatibility protein (HET)
MSICDNCRKLRWWLPDGLELQGSIADLLSNPECKSCRLVLHLLTSLDWKGAISWSKEKPRRLLEQHRFLITSTTPYKAVVRRSYPNSSSWHQAGIIRPLREVDLVHGDEDINVNGMNDKTTMPRRDLIKILRNSGVSRNTVIRRFKKFKGNQVNFSSMQYLLRNCDSNHISCMQRIENKRHIIPIRLIDVRDYRIVQSNTVEKYFALSYVWGKSQFLQANNGNIASLEAAGSLKSANFGSQLPNTIKDAIQFVRKMDGRYLWVDALCKYRRKEIFGP